MSSRALASQRNKRTAQQQQQQQQPQQTKPSTSQQQSNSTPSSQNKPSTNRELSIPEAFSILNNRVSNLEKKIFDEQDTYISNIPDTTSSTNNKQQIIDDIKKEINFNINQDVLKDYNFRIQQLEENSSNNIINPFKQTTTSVSQEEFNLMKLANNEATTKINSLENLTDTLNNNIDHLKDTIINLQNFTLEINNSFLQHMNAMQTNPLSFLDNLSNQANIHSNSDSDSDTELNDNYNHVILIDSEENKPISPDEVVMVVDEKDDLFHEPDEVSVTDITNNLEENEILNVPDNTPINSDKSDNSDNNNDNNNDNDNNNTNEIENMVDASNEIENIVDASNNII